MNEYLKDLQEEYGRAAPDQDAWNENLDELIAEIYTVQDLLDVFGDVIRPVAEKGRLIRPKMETWAAAYASDNAKIMKDTGGEII